MLISSIPFSISIVFHSSLYLPAPPPIHLQLFILPFVNAPLFTSSTDHVTTFLLHAFSLSFFISIFPHRPPYYPVLPLCTLLQSHYVIFSSFCITHCISLSNFVLIIPLSILSYLPVTSSLRFF